MLKEVGRSMPVPDPIVDLSAAITGSGVDPNDADAVLKYLENEQRLANAADAAIEQVNAASPKKRIVKMIEWAKGYLGADANAQQLAHVEGYIKRFAFNAIQFLERGDFHSLESLIGPFEWDVRAADKLATPRPPKPRRDPVPPAGGKQIGVGMSAFLRAMRGVPK
jgi:hypothetical protein